MRPRLSEDRSNEIVLLNNHRDIAINSEEVIDVFAKSNRQLNFCNLNLMVMGTF